LEQENKKSSENPVECESTDLSSGIKKQHPALPPTRSKSEHVLTSSGTYQADANLQLHTDNDPVISTSKPDPFLVSYDGLMESKVMETVQGKEASEIPDDSEASRNSYPGEALRDNPMEDGGNVNLPVAGSYKTSGTETVSTSDRNDTIRENSQERMVAKDTASMKVNGSIQPTSEVTARSVLSVIKSATDYVASSFQGFDAGLGLVTSRNISGGEISLRMNMGSHITVGAGLRLGFTVLEVFDTERDFRLRKGRDFKSAYIQRPDSVFISNISIRHRLIQVPIHLSYKFPVQNNWSVVVACGTDLDVRIRQVIGFDRRRGSENPVSVSLVVDRPAVALNNVVLSAGIQKDWSRFSFHAAPFIAPHVAQTTYRPQKANIGMFARLLYRF
jgi:hypothetical protein